MKAVQPGGRGSRPRRGSVTHPNDEERSLVLGIVLQELLCWVWGMSGSRHLKALIVFDEV